MEIHEELTEQARAALKKYRVLLFDHPQTRRYLMLLTRIQSEPSSEREQALDAAMLELITEYLEDPKAAPSGSRHWFESVCDATASVREARNGTSRFRTV